MIRPATDLDGRLARARRAAAILEGFVAFDARDLGRRRARRDGAIARL